jgi:hypothetical protein
MVGDGQAYQQVRRPLDHPVIIQPIRLDPSEPDAT